MSGHWSELHPRLFDSKILFLIGRLLAHKFLPFWTFYTQTFYLTIFLNLSSMDIHSHRIGRYSRHPKSIRKNSIFPFDVNKSMKIFTSSFLTCSSWLYSPAVCNLQLAAIDRRSVSWVFVLRCCKFSLHPINTLREIQFLQPYWKPTPTLRESQPREELPTHLLANLRHISFMNLYDQGNLPRSNVLYIYLFSAFTWVREAHQWRMLLYITEEKAVSSGASVYNTIVKIQSEYNTVYTKQNLRFGSPQN